jgi:hypothetical protein
VEEWVCESDWEKEKDEAVIAVLALDEKAVEPMRAILRLKSPEWAVRIGWKIPLGDQIFRGAFRNVVKKQQAIGCMDPNSAAGRALVPELIAMAEDRREFVQLRELALRYVHQHVPLTTEKSNVLVRLTGDAKLGGEASRYLQAFQREFRNEELDRIAKKMDDRSREATREEMEAVPESLFEEGRSLWETGR